ERRNRENQQLRSSDIGLSPLGTFLALFIADETSNRAFPQACSSYPLTRLPDPSMRASDFSSAMNILRPLASRPYFRSRQLFDVATMPNLATWFPPMGASGWDHRLNLGDSQKDGYML